ncbi:hypothetical protein L208DRAFT_1382714 [Tricholoma matsutake]|nr:hypothetical protein L208DRAFT_1382714 [Tricholoma matsutake 945]
MSMELENYSGHPIYSAVPSCFSSETKMFVDNEQMVENNANLPSPLLNLDATSTELENHSEHPIYPAVPSCFSSETKIFMDNEQMVKNNANLPPPPLNLDATTSTKLENHSGHPIYPAVSPCFSSETKIFMDNEQMAENNANLPPPLLNLDAMPTELENHSGHPIYPAAYSMATELVNDLSAGSTSRPLHNQVSNVAYNVNQQSIAGTLNKTFSTNMSQSLPQTGGNEVTIHKPFKKGPEKKDGKPYKFTSKYPYLEQEDGLQAQWGQYQIHPIVPYKMTAGDLPVSS